ncbi:MAG: hypothetical protein ABIH77_03925 [Pseudomonadota bacterium]
MTYRLDEIERHFNQRTGTKEMAFVIHVVVITTTTVTNLKAT